MKLSDLNTGKAATIDFIHGSASLKARIKAMGLSIGQEVVIVRRAVMNGPLQVRVGNTDLLIRQDQADLIYIV